jgi:hypothetical protein
MNRARRHGWPLRAALALVALAAVLGPRAADADGADALGRLFLTPAERAALDRERPRAGGPAADGWPRDLLPARAVPRQRVVLNGLVRREAGAPVVWINGRVAPAGAGSAPDRQARVAVRAAGGARLKPGQAWDPATGRISECAGCGAPAPAVPPAQPADAPAGPDAPAAPAPPAADPAAAPAPAVADPAAPASVAAARAAP